MALVVQKYGGSSLATPEDIKRIARSVVEEHRKGNQMVVVVSVMGDTTDHLVELAKAVSQNPPEQEMDMLLSVGERTSIALLAMAISDLGCQAISYTGSQVGIITDDRHTDARILEVRALRVREALESGKIVIIAGFQGVSINKEITTLGRGGTDTTALAVAAALQADRCEIMKDVDGIYIAEPRLVPQPKLNPQISYDEMIEMANMGAGVLKTEPVEIARHYQVKVAVGSSFSGKIGTIQKYQLNQRMAERRIKVQSFLMQPEYLEMVFQQRFLGEVKAFLSEIRDSEPAAGFSTRGQIGIIGIIGTGLNFNSDTALQIFKTLEKLRIEPQMFQVSELKISWMMPEERIDDTVKMLYGELVEKGGR